MLHSLCQRGRQVAALLIALATAVGLSGGGSSAPAPAAAETIRTATPSRAAVNAVTVSPLPRTPDASPNTQISFLGGPGTRVSDVQVDGSRSGRHSGRLEVY